MIYNGSTRLIDLNVSDLERIVENTVSRLMKMPIEKSEIVKGIGNLASMLGVSKGYVNNLKKDGKLEGCYTQRGKTIFFDVNKVKEML